MNDVEPGSPCERVKWVGCGRIRGHEDCGQIKDPFGPKLQLITAIKEWGFVLVDFSVFKRNGNTVFGDIAYILKYFCESSKTGFCL